MDALATEADEGRRRRRNSPGRCQQPMIRRSPNGATNPELIRDISRFARGGNLGNRNIQVPRGKENNRYSLSSGERKGKSLNPLTFFRKKVWAGVVGSVKIKSEVNRKLWNGFPKRVKDSYVKTDGFWTDT